MIEITEHKDGVSIKGHAGYAPHGQDIVCAGVSALTQSLVLSLERLTSDPIKYDVRPGMVDINYGNPSKHAQVLIDSFFIGVKEIAKEYPDYVQINQNQYFSGQE